MSGTIQTTRAGLQLMNVSSRAVKLYWLDRNAVRQPYGTIGPWEFAAQGSFDGYAFVLTDTDDRCVGLYLAQNRGRIVIRPLLITSQMKRPVSTRAQ